GSSDPAAPTSQIAHRARRTRGTVPLHGHVRSERCGIGGDEADPLKVRESFTALRGRRIPPRSAVRSSACSWAGSPRTHGHTAFSECGCREARVVHGRAASGSGGRNLV